MLYPTPLSLISLFFRVERPKPESYVAFGLLACWLVGLLAIPIASVMVARLGGGDQGYCRSWVLWSFRPCRPHDNLHKLTTARRPWAGDGSNDVGMFRAAGWSCAAANGEAVALEQAAAV